MMIIKGARAVMLVPTAETFGGAGADVHQGAGTGAAERDRGRRAGRGDRPATARGDGPRGGRRSAAGSEPHADPGELLADGFIWTEDSAPDRWLDDNAPLWLDDQPA